jgi:MFS family permease
MNIALTRPFGQRYAFVVAGVIFVCLMVAAGLRYTPGVLMLPLERSLGWSRDIISLGASIGIFLYGLMGPFAAALMESVGIKRTLLVALALLAVSTAASSLMSQPWHFMLIWGVLTGLASGCIAIVLAATIVNRWFVTNRGLMMGLLTASAATGALIFLPALGSIAEAGGWRPVVWTVAIACAALIPLVMWLLPERPSDVGLVPYGTKPGQATVSARRTGLVAMAFSALARASRTRTFWLLFATFYICGFTTNGLLGTQFIALCGDQGIGEVRASSLLALMGLFDLVGTMLSGWLTDRYDPRKLLFVYYGLRGLSLIYLPFSDFSLYSLGIFAVFYGLDWIATVPPTLRLTTEAFGERDAAIVFGWIAAGHQLGAASASYFAGWMRTVQGDYLQAFVIAGMTGVAAAVLSLVIRRGAAAPAAAG